MKKSTLYYEEIKEDVAGKYVDIVARGYEWICPSCEMLNHEIEVNTLVTCQECHEDFETNPPEHALGA